MGENKEKRVKLKAAFIKAVDAYMDEWCTKHGFEYGYDGWVADDTGGICMVGDYFVNFDDARYDIDNDLPETMYFDWYEYALDVYEVDTDRKITLEAYANGYRPYTDTQIGMVKTGKAKIRELQKELDELIDSFKKKNIN